MEKVENLNVILIVDKNGETKEVSEIQGIDIKFTGKNGKAIFGTPIAPFKNCKFEIGTNCTIKIETSKHIIKNFQVRCLANYNSVLIGENFNFNGGYFALDAESCLNIIIGDNCLFSSDIYFRVTDGHSIISLEDGETINEGGDIEVGDNVWLGRNTTVLKGSIIPKGCIVGANATVCGKFKEQNCIIAGLPAKIIKRNVKWVNPNTEKFNQAHKIFNESKEIIDKIEKNKGPTVSLIIPLFEGEYRLFECLDSLINQTLKNIEIILLDYGANEEVVKISNDYLKKDKRIKYLNDWLFEKDPKDVEEKNRLAKEYILGKYIIFIYPHDFVAPDMCEKLVVTAEALKTDCVEANYLLFKEIRGVRVFIKKTRLKDNQGKYYCMIEKTEDKEYELENKISGIYLKEKVSSVLNVMNLKNKNKVIYNSFYQCLMSQIDTIAYIKNHLFFFQE